MSPELREGPEFRYDQPLDGQLRVEITYDEGQWVAVEQLTGMFGEGDTRQDAFRDLLHGLSRLHSELDAHRDNLSARLEAHLRAVEADRALLDQPASKPDDAGGYAPPLPVLGCECRACDYLRRKQAERYAARLTTHPEDRPR